MDVPPPQAQTQPCAQDAGPIGCIDLALSPNTLIGDVFVDGQPVAGQVNTMRLHVAPSVPHTIEVNNVLRRSHKVDYNEHRRESVPVPEGTPYHSPNHLNNKPSMRSIVMRQSR